MKRLACAVAAPATLALLGLGHLALAQTTYIANDTVINATLPGVNPAAIIGYANTSDYAKGANGASPTVTLVGGGFASILNAFNSSAVHISDGAVGLQLSAYDTSFVDVTGGFVNNLFARENSVVNFSGGRNNGLKASDHSTLNVSGGASLYYLDAADHSTLNLSGGSFGTFLQAEGSGVINVFGDGLSATLIDPNFNSRYSEYVLSGQLSDGTDLAGKDLVVQNGSGAQVFLHNASAATPAPASLSVFALGMAALGFGLRRKRPRN